MNSAKTIQLVLKHYYSGNLKEAENLCKNIIVKQPNNPEVLFFLGIIYAQSGNNDSAIHYLKRSLEFNAINADALLALGVAYQQKGMIDDAFHCFNKTIELNPKNPEAYYYLALFFHNSHQLDEAVSYYRKVLELNPCLFDTYNRLGNALQENKQFNEAISYYQKAVQNNPADPTGYINIGIALHNKGEFDKADSQFQKALSLNPNLEIAYNYRGLSLIYQCRIGEAIKSFEASLRINPYSVTALVKLGHLFEEQGKVHEAETYYRRAMQIQPNYIIPYEALLMNMQYNPHNNAQTIFNEHVKYAKQFQKPLQTAVTPHNNYRTIKRPIRIGYVSPDFRRHSVAYFIEPAIAAHSRERFEVFCYSDVLDQDDVTKRLQGYTCQWRNIAGISDEKTIDLIQNDGIDILVDLAGYSANNRMLLFARKPAPVQVSWIGYPSTTGLTNIDYKIVDCYTDPPGMSEQFYTEKLIRLPDCFLCYLPDRESPEVGPIPVLTSGHITFGSFNNFPKVSSKTIELWTKILKSIPGSHLVLKSSCFTDRSTHEYATSLFAQQGIDAGRIDLFGWQTSTRGHLGIYNRIDIGLDPFPYNGTTTTCEALWMGVPVITLSGNTHASRVGMSLLSNVGLPELVAGTPDEYVEIAVKLAEDLNRLQLIRKRLRDMMSKSVLTDSKRFISSLEASYRKIWKDWCDN
ncbi:MAG: tetratricopeptide repeat protein [Nitrospira sp.]|nr:tetratricopeptide repeat protein [Nitrospira sp.]